MNCIEIMKKELEELKEKIEKLDIFLEKEMKQPDKTDEKQRVYLGTQLAFMQGYATMLDCRLDYEHEKQINRRIYGK